MFPGAPGGARTVLRSRGTVDIQVICRIPAREGFPKAWFSGGGDRLHSGLVPADAPNSLPLWAANPDFFGPSLPRTDFRVITIVVAAEGFASCISKKPEDPDNISTRHSWRMYEFMTTTDWQRVAQLLDYSKCVADRPARVASRVGHPVRPHSVSNPKSSSFFDWRSGIAFQACA
jgi:hypothetical protein